MKLRVPYFDMSKISSVNRNDKANKGSITTNFRGTVLGAGQFGTVYKSDPKEASILLDHIDTYYRGVWRKVNCTKGVNKVVVKVMKAPRGNVQGWLKNALREMYIQHHLSKAPAKVIKGKTFDVKRYVPEPFFGGYVRSTREFIIVMKMQPGKPLQNRQFLRNKQHYLEIERAYISMLLNNILHVDFHAGNIMVTEDGHIHLIDFGGSVLLSDVLPKIKVKPFKQRLYRFISMWPEHTTYVGQAKNLNHTILDLGVEEALEDELNIWPQSASNTMLEMRGFVQKKNNIKNLSSRKLTNTQRNKMLGRR